MAEVYARRIANCNSENVEFSALQLCQYEILPDCMYKVALFIVYLSSNFRWQNNSFSLAHSRCFLFGRRRSQMEETEVVRYRCRFP